MVKVISIMIIAIDFLMIASSQNTITYEEYNKMMALENFKNSFNWADSVSMKLDISSTPIGIPGKGPWELVYIFNKDHERIEWNGNAFVPDSNGNPDPKKNAILRTVVTDRAFVSVVGNPGHLPLGASITTEVKGIREDLLDYDTYGGPLLGKIYGCNHKSIPELLGESNDVSLREENIKDINCCVLEGTTKFGKVTAWVAPEKDYAPLKWIVERKVGDFINDTPLSQTEQILSVSQFECKEIQQIGNNFIPTKATFAFTSKLKDGSSSSILNFYTVSDIHLNPDFNALGAFKIDLPEGTKITVPESPGIRYIWKDGKVIPDVNKSMFDEIDKTIDKFKQQQ